VPIESPPAVIWQVPQPPPQAPIRIPGADVVVEVVADLPLRTQIQDVTRLLGRRQQAASGNRSYLPTILELITLVNSNPARPPGRMWNSINVLTIGYDPEAKVVKMTYCLERCTHDPVTGALDPDSRMISYSAPEATVNKRLDKKLKALKKYAK